MGAGLGGRTVVASPGRDRRGIRATFRLALAAASALALLAVPAPAAVAAIGFSVTPTFPTTVTVGLPGLPASLQIANTSMPPESDGNVTLSTVTLVAACGTAAPSGSGDCPVAQADPGVFRLSPTGTGEPGTACADQTFTIAIVDPATGEVTLTPTGGPVVLTPPATANSVCRIDISFDVLKAPTKPANPSAPGTVNTAQIGFADGTAAVNGATGGGAGSSSMTVVKAAPAVTTTATASAGGGATITDTAHLATAAPPGPAPTGTITFSLFGANDATCTGAAAFTSTVTVSGGTGDYASAPFTPTAAGTYRWLAAYSGDANNQAVATACSDPGETTIVTQATPTISTTASATVQSGGVISDSATVSGGLTPAGTIAFSVFGPGNPACTGTAVFTSIVTVAGNGTYNSGAFTPTAPGTYNWVAVYSGDADNAGVTSGCGAANESVTVTAANPAIVTHASPPVAAGGGTITDTATLSGGAGPTGTITFTLFGPNDATCTGAAIFTSTVTVVGNGNYTSAVFTAIADGTYRWVATYGGDASNDPVAAACNDANESVVVAPAIPALVTHASAAVALGGAISDTATLSGGIGPTGTIAFTAFGPNDATCSGPPAFTSTVAVDTGDGDYRSLPFTATTPGTYRFVARYSGNPSNASVTTACNDPNESVAVSLARPTIATHATASGAVAGDTATLAGGANPTGTITFTVFGPNDAACSGPPAFTSIVAVSGNGDYSSAPFTVPAAGTYRFVATYAGDAANAAAGPTACSDPGEAATVGGPAIAVTKSASPPSRPEPGGTFTFTVAVSNPGTLEAVTITALVDDVYGDLATRAGSTCGGLIGVTLAPGATSAPCTFTGPFTGLAGASQTDTVTATGTNLGISVTATAQATVTLTKSPLAIATQVTRATGPLGSSFQDAATLGPAPAGAAIATGTVVFNVYGPGDAGCTGAPVFTSTGAVDATGTSATSAGFAPTGPGTYRVVATYSGDANYAGSISACGDPREAVTIRAAATTATTLTARPAGSAGRGQRVRFTAAVAAVAPGAGTPTGSVAFTVDGVAAGSRPLSGTTAQITVRSLAVGSHKIVATYSGDANFRSSSGSLIYRVTCSVTISIPLPGGLELTLSVCVGGGWRAAVSPLHGLPAGSPVIDRFVAGVVRHAKVAGL